jgi:hypothetical protein
LLVNPLIKKKRLVIISLFPSVKFEIFNSPRRSAISWVRENSFESTLTLTLAQIQIRSLCQIMAITHKGILKTLKEDILDGRQISTSIYHKLNILSANVFLLNANESFLRLRNFLELIIDSRRQINFGNYNIFCFIIL